MTVHILRHGRALCGNVHGLPGQWDRSQLWIGCNDPDARELATCAECKRALELIAAADTERNLPEVK